MIPEKLVNLPKPKDNWTAKTALEDKPDWCRQKYGCDAKTGFRLTCEREKIHNYGTEYVWANHLYFITTPYAPNVFESISYVLEQCSVELKKATIHTSLYKSKWCAFCNILRCWTETSQNLPDIIKRSNLWRHKTVLCLCKHRHLRLSVSNSSSHSVDVTLRFWRLWLSRLQS